MEIKKQCQICKTRLGKFTCKYCGALVCENCYDKEKGICIKCSRGKIIWVYLLAPACLSSSSFLEIAALF